MRLCDRCATPLAPGSAHLDADNCIAALQHRLDEALKCPGCGKPADQCEGGKLACLPCGAVAFARKKTGGALLWAMQKGYERMNQPADDLPPQGGGGGKRASDR